MLVVIGVAGMMIFALKKITIFGYSAEAVWQKFGFYIVGWPIFVIVLALLVFVFKKRA